MVSDLKSFDLSDGNGQRVLDYLNLTDEKFQANVRNRNKVPKHNPLLLSEIDLFFKNNGVYQHTAQ
jgi:hypothetical protein